MPNLNASATVSRPLRGLLKERFGFEAFRPYQEEVCEAVYGGQSALLVMPTGAGKSLCYQVPGLARGGTTLVVSPLVALMEDQVQKLKALGFRAERIHSGRERAESRAVCEAYLAGALDYLFIAPERLAVPGFPEMLAKRRLALIAIDEAHCISQWGHDFRPEYRMLGARLPTLRQGEAESPCPILALTATATPTVQRDILSQLQLDAGKCFIHGFRRTNIGVSVLELATAERLDRVRNLLASKERRPAIVYASTRKNAELIAEGLKGDYRVGFYHGGMGKEERERTQLAFLEDRTEVMVATLAFGMGIDKPDVRTVVHAALPSSLESYYQEIGRAGRDGLDSKAYLMWSFADRKMQEFLHEKNYPALEELDKVFAVVAQGDRSREGLAEELKLDGDLVDAAIQKLWIHGGLKVEPDDTLRATKVDWRPSYARQSRHRLDQIQRMVSFAEGTRCRMLALIQHFGDEQDSGRGCGHCDICAPDESAFRAPDEAEMAMLKGLVLALRAREGQSLGRIHREAAGKLDRSRFETCIQALSKSGLVRVLDRSFEKDGETIRYRSVEVDDFDDDDARWGSLRVPAEAPKAPRATTKRKAAAARSAPNATSFGDEIDEATKGRIERLKAWRLEEARRRKAPAFTILSDKTLMAVAASGASSAEQLQAVHGMGPKLVEKHGESILRLLASR